MSDDFVRRQLKNGRFLKTPLVDYGSPEMRAIYRRVGIEYFSDDDSDPESTSGDRPGPDQEPPPVPMQSAKRARTETESGTKSKRKSKSKLSKPSPSVRTTTAQDLRACLAETARVVAEGEGAEESGGLVLFNPEVAAAAQSKREEPRKFADKCFKRMLIINAPEKMLAAQIFPFKYEVIRRIFAATGPLGDRFVEFDAKLQAAAELSATLVKKLLSGWDADLVRTGDPTKPKTGSGVTADSFAAWNPTEVTYRAIALPHATGVPNYVDEFLNAFSARDGTTLVDVHSAVSDELRGHPFVSALDCELREARDAKVRRGLSTSKNERLPRRHPKLGPLKIEDYRQHEDAIVRAAAAATDPTCQAYAAAAAELSAAFPTTPIDAILAQHEFESKLRLLYHLVEEALFTYVTPDGGCLFGDDTMAQHAIFCLAQLPSFVGGAIVDLHTRDGVCKWYMRFLERFISFQEPQLKVKNYKPQSEFVTAVGEKRRHAATRSTRSQYAELVGRIEGFVQSEIVYALQNFYNYRAQAFEDGGLREKSKSKKHGLAALGGFVPNDPDSFDDLLKSRPPPQRSIEKSAKAAAAAEAADAASVDGGRSRQTSWLVNGSKAEELALRTQATKLATITVGLKYASEKFPERLQEAGIEAGIEAGTEAGDGGQTQLVLHNTESLEPKEGDEADEADGGELKWLQLRERADKATASMRLRNAIAHAQKSIDNAEAAVEVTKLVANRYMKRYDELRVKDREIGDLPVDQQLTASQFLHKTMNESRRREDSVNKAVQDVFDEKFRSACTWIETVVAMAGSPPTWNWDVEDKHVATTESANTRCLGALKKMKGALVEVLELVEKDPNAKVFDFVSGNLTDLLDCATEHKTFQKTPGESPDFVGFEASSKVVSKVEEAAKWLRLHTYNMRAAPNEFLRTMIDVVRDAFVLVLDWLGVLVPFGSRLMPCQKPRTNVGVAHLMKILSLAAAHDALDDGADSASPRLFYVTPSAIKIGTADEFEAFARSSQRNWRCLCALAALTQQTLLYNRDVTFDAGEVHGLNECDDGLVSVSLSGDLDPPSLVVVDECARQAHAADLDTYVSTLVPKVLNYPPCPDWWFSDEHWTTPLAFEVLLAWLPTITHFESGFYNFPGVRDRPEINNGFLNAKDNIQDVGTIEVQWWGGVMNHPLARAHGRLPTPPNAMLTD
jgi:hypothetical protein